MIEWGVLYETTGDVYPAESREQAERWVQEDNENLGHRISVLVYRVPWTVIETDQAPVLP